MTFHLLGKKENVELIESEGQLIPTLAHKFTPLPKIVWNWGAGYSNYEFPKIMFNPTK